MHSLKYYALKYYVSIVYMKHFLPFITIILWNAAQDVQLAA